jgi:hypothetical protein
MKSDTASRRMGSAGLAWRIGATAVLLSLCVLSSVRGASGAFEAASLPVATLTGQNGIISGTTRVMGNHFLLYNGTRLESMTQSMEVNFERGGSMVMCPRSQLQILTANENAGMMLAFQSGGSQQPFPLRMGDEVITPDWRVELTSDARKGDMGVVQVDTNSHGDLCLQGNSQMGAYFRVTQLIGDGSFRVAGGQSERFVDGKMETSSDGCGCNAQFEAKTDMPPAIDTAAPALDTKPPAITSPTPSSVRRPISTTAVREKFVAAAAPAPAALVPVALAPAATVRRFTGSTEVAAPPVPFRAAAAKPKEPRHPQDVVGYVSSFVHRVFGR